MIIDAAGTPWFLEASVMPGLTETSTFALALDAAGHDVGSVYAALVQAALVQAGLVRGRLVQGAPGDAQR
jgi:D-alanine-D-alanine ligase